MRTTSFLASLGLLACTMSALPTYAQKSKSARRASTPIAVATQPAAPVLIPMPMPRTLSLGEQNVLGSYHLGVGFVKTTHLVFPYAVSYVDLGSSGIIADKAQGAENIVKVKANQQGFAQTNMTIVTTDGHLYSFLIDFEVNPRVINYNFGAGTPAAGGGQGALAQFTNQSMTQSELETCSRQVLGKKRTLRRARQKKNDITLSLPGMYTRNDIFFVPITMVNKSNITYDVDFVKFYIRDKKVAKRTAIQESEVNPVFVYNGGAAAIPGPGGVSQVYVLKKFTIPDDKNLVVEMFEKGGGRHLSFNVTNADILRARKLAQ